MPTSVTWFSETNNTTGTREGAAMCGEIAPARAGKPAPDFETDAFMSGELTKIKLADYLGKWVVLCFYPKDFTFA